MKTIVIELPESFLLNGRRFFKRSEIEHLKKVLIAKATGAPEPLYSAPTAEEFVNATKVAREFGIARRTFSRRVSEAEERRGRALPKPVDK